MWLVRFPFSDLASTKVRPALVLATHREELIIVGIFSKISNRNLQEAWGLIKEDHPEFSLTGLKKTSLIRADKIATIARSVLQRKLDILPSYLLILVQNALKKALNIP
nr:type II toxin-antitoxin system PemK/MazF family toxin [Pleurocapsa sp. PCC 7327]